MKIWKPEVIDAMQQGSIKHYVKTVAWAGLGLLGFAKAVCRAYDCGSYQGTWKTMLKSQPTDPGLDEITEEIED